MIYIFPFCDRYSCKYILLAVHKIALASNEMLNLFATKHFCLPSSKVFISYISLISSMLKWQICRTNFPLHLYLFAVGLKLEVMKKSWLQILFKISNNFLLKEIAMLLLPYTKSLTKCRSYMEFLRVCLLIHFIP